MEFSEHAVAHQISAVLGWLELGNAKEALAELEAIPEKFANEPGLLEVRWTLLASEQKWQDALATARKMIDLLPDQAHPWLHQAYALRRVESGGLQAAWDALIPVLERFPGEATIPYNLACYACQLDRVEQARHLLERAVRVGDRTHVKSMALLDADLEPLWTEIESW